MKTLIWSAECPSCKSGMVLLYEKGGIAKCNKDVIKNLPVIGNMDNKCFTLDLGGGIFIKC